MVLPCMDTQFACGVLKPPVGPSESALVSLTGCRHGLGSGFIFHRILDLPADLLDPVLSNLALLRTARKN